ncbi:hypothetical protein DOY81_008817 [Sarcophaga bullata]|nr:hypothetical protein DOY81_008817 [Sarcophaga bullata]
MEWPSIQSIRLGYSLPLNVFFEKMKYGETFLYFLCISNTLYFAVCKTNSINDDISEEIFSCDYTRFETQLERMKLQAEINHDTQLRQQKELFSNLMKKINDLSLKIDEIQDKLLVTNKINTENLQEIIRHECQPRAIELAPVVDDKIVIMIQIKDKLEKHDQILNQILNNQNDNKELRKKEIVIMEDYTQTLKHIVSDNIAFLKKIDKNLNTTEDNSIQKIDRLKFCQDIQQDLNATEISQKVENHKLTSNQSYPTNCADFVDNYCADNKCLIKNDLYGPAPFMIACNNSVDGGGWTVIQRRINGSVDFYRDWSEYKSGFGNMDGEFFIGLEKLHALTAALKPVELLIHLQDFDDVVKYAKYDDFQVGNETENYKLIKVGSYTGNAGDSFSQHVGYDFSTRDRDNDGSIANCAKVFKAAWWYRNCFQRLVEKND